MRKAIPAAEANRRFSEILREVKSGSSVIVTSHGKPVAKISPAGDSEAESAKAQSRLFARLRKEKPGNAGKWTRDELYDES